MAKKSYQKMQPMTAKEKEINISPLSFLYLTMHCLGLFGRILLYQEVVLLAIVLRVRCSSDHASDPGDGREGRLNHHTWGCQCVRSLHTSPNSQSSTHSCNWRRLCTIEAANRDDRPSY